MDNGIGNGDQARNPDFVGDYSFPDIRNDFDFVQADRDICYTGRVVGVAADAHRLAAVAAAGDAMCFDKPAASPVSAKFGSKRQGALAAAG